MSIITLILAGIVALEHLYIMYLETFATHSDTTSRVFNMRCMVFLQIVSYL